MNEIAKKALYGPPKVGGDTLSFCTRCKMELAHVIVSMVDGHPAKVICKTCKSEHKARKPPKTASPRAKSSLARPTSASQTVRAVEYWEKKLREAKRVPRPYAVSETFTAGDVIEHVRFGSGVVEEIRGNGKMVVFFKDGEKTLVFGVNANPA